MNKVVAVKKGNKVLFEFVVKKSELTMAKKLGISDTAYITEKAKFKIEEMHYGNTKRK
jgi:hypothetical protein